MKFTKIICFAMLLLVTSLLGVSFSQTVDLTISNQHVSGGYLYFEIHMTRTSDWSYNNLGDCSLYLNHNENALSSPTITYTNPNLSSGNGFSITNGVNSPYIYVTITFGFGSSWAIAQDTDYHLFTVRLNIDDAGQNSGLSWNTIASAIMDAADQSTIESYYGGSDVSLPVELATFSAKQDGNSVNLLWATESESNNLGFILERRGATTDWVKIASYITHTTLQGKGTTSERSNYAYTDAGLQAGESYSYRLSDVSVNGEINELGTLNVELIKVPGTTALLAPYPNPFNPVTKISYDLAKAGTVEIAVYNILGGKVATLVDGNQSAGSYHTSWNGLNDAGQQSATGMYQVVMKTVQGVQSHKVLLMK